MDNDRRTDSDAPFTFHLSEDMETRSLLRTGLVKAQQLDTGKVPVFVSWPSWLEDGIICMFAKDFTAVVERAVQETALRVGNLDPGSVAAAAVKPLKRTIMHDPALGAPHEGGAAKPPVHPARADSGTGSGAAAADTQVSPPLNPQKALLAAELLKSVRRRK